MYNIFTLWIIALKVHLHKAMVVGKVSKASTAVLEICLKSPCSCSLNASILESTVITPTNTDQIYTAHGFKDIVNSLSLGMMHCKSIVLLVWMWLRYSPFCCIMLSVGGLLCRKINLTSLRLGPKSWRTLLMSSWSPTALSVKIKRVQVIGQTDIKMFERINSS